MYSFDHLNQSFLPLLPTAVLSQNISTICLDKMSHKIKWHDIKEDMKSTFENLIETNDFVDVSLVCEDGQLVEAHKVIFLSIFFGNSFIFLFY